MNRHLTSARTLLLTMAGLGPIAPVLAALDPDETSCWASSADSNQREFASRSVVFGDGRLTLR